MGVKKMKTEEPFMNTRLVHQIPPADNNPRNSEGAFLRGKQGEILFAFSRYSGNSCHDHASCDIALIVSYDEGESWSEPRIIVPASFFGTKNVMSVSALVQRNGDLAFYFIIKENDLSTTVARAISTDGKSFTCCRCRINAPAAYYVLNNDRLVRRRNGQLLYPCAYISVEEIRAYDQKRVPFRATCMVSDDDGESFYLADFDYVSSDPVNEGYGFQEPGVFEHEDGSLYYFIRTGYGRQYESFSAGNINEMTFPRPSVFTSPDSPMQIKAYDGVMYAVYNPIPRANGFRATEAKGTHGRTPFVLRKSTDGGKTWGPLNVVEDEFTRGYCYPAMFATRDGHLLLGYCRGDGVDGNMLCRLGISKVEIASIE